MRAAMVLAMVVCLGLAPKATAATMDGMDLLGLKTAGAAGAAPAGPAVLGAGAMPFAGHNCDPEDGTDRKLREALDAGFRHVEIDVTWDAKRGQVVVTHSEDPAGSEPEADAYLAPLWARFAGGTGCTLIFDCKSSSPDLAAGLDRLLARHRAALSTMTPDGAFTPGPVTACMSGDGACKDAFRLLQERAGRYLGFADVVYGEGDWKKNVGDYVPRGRPGYVRFLTLHGQNVKEAKGRTGAGGFVMDKLEGLGRALRIVRGPNRDETWSGARMRTLARLSRAAGYAVRLYTINDEKVWELGARAGIPMMATDDCREAAAWWRERR